jgi:hypothetical protein
MSTDMSIVRDSPKTRPEKPNGLSAAGLRWRPRSNGWLAYWEASPELTRRGYEPKSQRIWTGKEPTLEEWRYIASECRRYESQMRTWQANHKRAAPELGRDPEDPGPLDWRGSTLVPPPVVDWDNVPLTMDAWLGRDLPAPDFILGD